MREGYVYALPGQLDDVQAAPLLCSGIIGYRALRRAAVPAGGTLGIYGFGASAHLTAQLAVAQGIEVHVLTRGDEAQQLALSLGAASARGAYDQPPVPLDSAILFAPVGDLVPTHSPRSTRAAPSPWPASISATSPPSTTPTISSASAP